MSLTDRVAAFFEAHPHEWVDGHVLAKIGGYAGWSARVRDMRKPPRSWQIDNRVRYEARVWGTETITEYRYVPAVTDVTPRRDGVTNCHDESVLTL